MLSKQRVVAVHAEDFATSLARRRLHSSAPSFVSFLAASVSSLECESRARFRHSSLAIPFPSVFPRASAASESHANAASASPKCIDKIGVALREYVSREANVMLPRSRRERRIEAVGRNFQKIQENIIPTIKILFRMRSGTISTTCCWWDLFFTRYWMFYE